MKVTTDKLLAIIGELYIENLLLKEALKGPAPTVEQDDPPRDHNERVASAGDDTAPGKVT